MNTNIQTALAVVRDAGQLPVTWNTIDECTQEILAWKNTIGLGVYRVGQALLWAKERLPHGQFGEWLRDKVDFSPSTAQNFMKIAREVDENSAIARLPYTKILALLELPAAERESFAEANGVEDKSAAEIRRLIREKEEAEKRAEQVELDMRAQLKEAQHRADMAIGSNQLQLEKLRKQREEIEEKAREIERLRNQEPTIIREVPDDYEALKKRLAAAEDEADRLADELDRMKLDEAKQDEDQSANRILSAIGGMMAMCGRDPAVLSKEPGRLSRNDWAMILDKVSVLRAWCDAMEAAAAGR